MANEKEEVQNRASS